MSFGCVLCHFVFIAALLWLWCKFYDPEGSNHLGTLSDSCSPISQAPSWQNKGKPACSSKTEGSLLLFWWGLSPKDGALRLVRLRIHWSSVHRALCDLPWEVTSPSQGTSKGSAYQQLWLEIMLNDRHASFLPHHFTSQLLEKCESLVVLAQCYRRAAFPVPPARGKQKTNPYIPADSGSLSQCTSAIIVWHTGHRFHTELEIKFTHHFKAST